MPGSSLRGRCRAERSSFALSGPCEEEVCRVDSSGQVNSGQMGPRYLPGVTRRAGFAQLSCLFALGRAFPSVRRQQRCQDVTPAALPGSSITVLARCLHPGCGCCCGTAGLGGCAAVRATDPGTTASSPHQRDAQVSSTVARRAHRTLGARQCWGRGGTMHHPGPTRPICCRVTGAAISPVPVGGGGWAVPGWWQRYQVCSGTCVGAPHTQPRSAVPAGCSRPWLRDPFLAHLAPPATPGKPAPFPAPGGKLRHRDVQDRSRDVEERCCRGGGCGEG